MLLNTCPRDVTNLALYYGTHVVQLTRSMLHLIKNQFQFFVGEMPILNFPSGLN